MTVRLPPRYFNVPRLARFRQHRLPRELYYTWETIYSLGWINRYEFTPPLLTRELAELCGLEERAFQSHVQKLKAWAWFSQIESTRNGNVYRPNVPADTPESCGRGAASDFEPASNGTDFSGCDGTAVGAIPGETEREGCSEMHPSADNIAATAGIFSFRELVFRGRIPAVVANSVITRTREERFRIAEALQELGLIDEEAQEELLSLRHVTPEYTEDWLMSYRLCGRGRDGERKLSPGYYRQQMREQRQPPYAMSPRQRREYREQKDFEFEQQATEERMEETR